ncbi:hypothetical protein [Pseudoxanthomonas suwonensis]|uniref:hypothetical protein n=1 Tax=Pseudoxanthomonas suwonensis TaxID=314722 RepID=UPI00138F58A4|nr:hypothetical protein [Pseudoxanthomonas suwonensis]KAF1703631.1 hypothetical protein CSC68_03735 [Pseudoxanthomonas suwonensis]
MNRILLVDLGERELKERQRLRARNQVLETMLANSATTGGITSTQHDELEEIRRTLGSDVVADPFYRKVASTVAQKPWEKLAGVAEDDDDDDSIPPKASRTDFVHMYGLIGSQRTRNIIRRFGRNEREIIGICGLLQLDGTTDAARQGFVKKVSAAQGEYREYRDLFDAAFEYLDQKYPVVLRSQVQARLIDPAIYGVIERGGKIGDPVPGGSDRVCVLSGRNVAAVVRKLAGEGVSANDPWLASRIENAYEMQSGAVNGAPPSSLEIPLPDLEEATDVEIVRENLEAAQAIYFAYQLEEARLPQVVERIVELFRAGLLPLSYGKTGDYLYDYYKKSAERITEGERRDLYMRAFGAPGGDPSLNQPNREFAELWLRFISAVSAFGRQLSVDRMFRSQVPLAVSQEQVRKAARDLAASLSRNCYGIAYQFSKELKTLIIEYRDLLSDPEIRGAFGARDMWQVIDQVNANYLGGARNSHRYRTQARAGAVVIAWLARNHQRLTNRFDEVIHTGALTNPQLRGSDRPMEDPTDWDLLQACEQWLAVGGVQDNRIEEYAQPVESPTITSKPIEMPQIARDILDSAGIGLPSF